MNPPIIEEKIDLKKRFILGLEQYNLTFEEVRDNWKYCGGDSNNHYSYFKLLYPGKKIPNHEDYCVCGHDILYNCYITDGKEMLVLGSCCIKRFMKHNNRTCEVCNKPHKNRNVNRCNVCRIGYCEKCKKECKPTYKTCYNCFKKQ